MNTQTITIPAREVRPGDVLFGMPVTAVRKDAGSEWRYHFLMVSSLELWLHRFETVTVERPVPSDPIGTVRARFGKGGHALFSVTKVTEIEWQQSGLDAQHMWKDADVADFPILWKPGMPIPTEGVRT